MTQGRFTHPDCKAKFWGPVTHFNDVFKPDFRIGFGWDVIFASNYAFPGNQEMTFGYTSRFLEDSRAVPNNSQLKKVYCGECHLGIAENL
jgi:hypothetical protein